MASIKKKAADTAVALVVTDMIIGGASISLEQAQVETSTIEPICLLELALILLETPRAKEEDQPKEVHPEGTSHLVKDTVIDS